MYMLTLLLLAASPVSAGRPVPGSFPDVEVGPAQTVLTWECPDLVRLDGLGHGLTGFMAAGCAFSGPGGGVLLPGKNLLFAVPPGSGVRLEVVPEGVRSIGHAAVARADVSTGGIDIFGPAETDSIPSSWGFIADTGLFRRTGFAIVRLHPVILRSGVLVTADRLRVRLSYSDAGRPMPSGGPSGRIFDALFAGGDLVWESTPSRQDPGPFWGLPWYALEVDTAGIYRVNSWEIPQAVGAPSSSLALYCGRGRDMGNEPWNEAYSPREVPVIVDDGGDGIFDQGDSFIFFGRGLSWWEPGDWTMPAHFNHRFDEVNAYWLTWGAGDGARMDVQDGQLTGAPAVPGSFLSRYHFEQNTQFCRGVVGFGDEWAWLRSAGSSDTWHYFDFQAPGASGSGSLRISLASTEGKQHRIRIHVNSAVVCDTVWSGTGSFQPTIDIDGLEPGGNSMALQVVRELGTDIIYLDWFQVFPWTVSNQAAQSHVPLEWLPGRERQRFDWEAGLDGSLVFLVGGDTLANRITVEDTGSFEFQVPDDWQSRELWIVEENGLLSPAVISSLTPGRIMGSVDGAECVYLAADEFFDAAVPLADRSGAVAFAASEVYQEFNGGIRDPGAVRAFVYHMLNNWDPVPMDLVLVGGGTWDPRNFVSSRISHIDIQYTGTGTIVSDDRFSIVGSSGIPQVAVSRMAVGNASDLQMVVQRSIEYRQGGNTGDWQTRVIGAADDERSPLHSSDERYHTQSVERLLTDWLPGVLRPEKMYMIFYEWNSVWSKPEARADYIDMWSDGALVSFYLGHGSFDQLADEGLMYLEDIGLLACGPRLPVAFFGSCDVGRFQNPSTQCIGQQVTTSPAGGAILGIGATDKTSGPMNETLVARVLEHLFSRQELSVGVCLMLGKIEAGYGMNQAQYILFGDGSLPLAFPWETFDIQSGALFSGQQNTVSGTAPGQGLLMAEAWESCRPDTYYTFRQSLPIGYLSIPGRLYSGTAAAGPDFSFGMFVPVDADTGRLARTQLIFLSSDELAAASTFPSDLLRGDPAEDTQGPEIELWIQGYRNSVSPEVSGEVVARAVLSDSSGINLLGNVGRQLALYIDGSPQDVSEYFEYDRGSSTTGSLSFSAGVLSPGGHTLGLRAADGMLNISQAEMEFSVTQDNALVIQEVFPYPNPCAAGTSLNWTQNSPGTVEISIYTVAGRRVVRFRNIEGEAGYNQFWWDCRDADGDDVASGAYIFVVSAVSFTGSGERSEVSGVIAVMREP